MSSTSIVSSPNAPASYTEEGRISPGTQFKWGEFMQYFGPGLLVSIAYLDPGNLAGDISAGVTGGYSLLWVLFLATLLGYFFQNRAMMLGLVAGKDMAKLCREHYTKKTSILLWLMAEIAIIGSDIQEVLGSAIALQILFDLKLWIGVLLTIFSTVLILFVKHYGMRVIEIIFAVLIGAMSICFFWELGLISPDFSDLLQGVFVPAVKPSAVQAMVGLIGAVLMPHNLYLHSSLIYERKVPRHDQSILKKSIFYFKIETGIALLLSFFISLAVIGTFAFWENTDNDDLSLSGAAVLLNDRFGAAAKYIWGIGLLAAGQSSTLTGTLAGQYVMTGFVKIKISKFRRALFTRMIAIIPSIIIAFLNNTENFNEQLNVLQAIQLPFAVIPLLKLSCEKSIMGNFTINKYELYILSLLSAAIVGVNYYSSIPDEIDWSSASIYIIFTVMVLYFAFLGFLIFTKVSKQPESNKSSFAKEQLNV